jgi:PAS domain-containing protein
VKIWLKGIVFFLIGTLLIGGLVWIRYQQMYSDHLAMREIAFHSAYESIVHTFRLVSQTIVEENILQDEILKNVHAIVTTEGDQQYYQRGLLYRKLYPMYERISQHSIRQLHFHFPNNHSMLRFHIPDHAYDDLTLFRPSVVIANKQNCEVHGYESGRIVHGFRHVYPLNYQNLHIGSVEISNSFPQIRAELLINDVIDSTDYMFIMLKEDLWHKLAPGQEHFYVESLLSADYLSENTQSGEYINFGGTAEISDKLISLQVHLKNHPLLRSGLDSKKDFHLVTRWEKQIYSVLFHSIPNVEGKHAAYILSFQGEPFLQSLQFAAIRNLIVFVFALALLIFFWVRLKHVKCEQEHTLAFLKTMTSNMGEGLYATDSKGNITYLNTEASALLGYSEDEVLNKNAHEMFHVDDLGH